MKKVLVIPVLIVLLFSCKSKKEEAKTDLKNEEVVVKTEKLIHPKFSLENILGDFIVSEMTDAELGMERPTLRIEANGNISGNNGCNTFFGRINPKSNNSIDKLGSTRMACSGVQGDLERIFMGWLRKVDSIARVDNEIHFFSEGNSVIVARELTLDGDFQVISVGKIYSENKGMKFTISEGVISGNTGCNSFFGSVFQKGRDVKFMEIAATEKACKEFDSSLESIFLKGLTEVSYFIQKENKIEFYRGVDLLFTAKKVSEK